MDNLYYMFIIIGSFIIGLKLKCKSKCCDFECELDKKQNEDGTTLREIKIIKKSLPS